MSGAAGAVNDTTSQATSTAIEVAKTPDQRMIKATTKQIHSTIITDSGDTDRVSQSF